MTYRRAAVFLVLWVAAYGCAETTKKPALPVAPVLTVSPEQVRKQEREQAGYHPGTFAFATEGGSCAYPGSEDILPQVADGDYITSSGENHLRDCVNSVQVELGVNPSGTYTDLSTRLDNEFPSLNGGNRTTYYNQYACGSPVSTSCTKNYEPITNNVMYADQFPGADIGARVNAALGNCDGLVGNGNRCTIRLSPAKYTQTSAIKISRSEVTLDCAGATLAVSSSMHDVAIRINIDTIGTTSNSTLSNITVQNCILDGSSQTSLSDWDVPVPPDNRAGQLAAYNVLHLTVDNIEVVHPLSHGIWASVSSGTIHNARIVGYYRYSAPREADGIVTSGVAGGTLQVTDARADNIYGDAFRALSRSQLTNISVNGTGRACIATEGFVNSTWTGSEAPSYGVQVSNAHLKTCGLTDTSGTAAALIAINGVSPQFSQINIGLPGQKTIYTSGTTGALFNGINAECLYRNGTGGGYNVVWGAGSSGTLANSRFIANGTGFGGCAPTHSSKGIQVLSNYTTFSNLVLDGLSVTGPSYNGIELTGTSFFDVTIQNSEISHWPGRGLTMDASLIGGIANYLANVRVLNNTFWGNAVGVQLTRNSGTLTSVSILGNQFYKNTSYPMIVNQAGSYSSQMVTIANNQLDSDIYYGVPETQLPGLSYFGNIGAPSLPDQQYVTVNWGSSTPPSGYGLVFCTVTPNGRDCHTADSAKTVLGVYTGMFDSTRKLVWVATRGLVYGASCYGTVNIGDLMQRSASSNGAVETASSPAVGEVIGVAYSTCTSGRMTLLVGKQ